MQLVQAGPVALLFLGITVFSSGTAVQILNLVLNRAFTSLQVMRPSLSRAARAEARAVLFGVVLTLLLSPLIGFVVNEETRLFDAGHWAWFAFALTGTEVLLGVVGAVGTRRLIGASEAGASSWSALERDLTDLRRQNDLDLPTLTKLEEVAHQLTSDGLARQQSRAGTRIPQHRIPAAADRMRRGERNRSVAAALIDRAWVRQVLFRSRAGCVWLLPPAGVLVIVAGVLWAVADSPAPAAMLLIGVPAAVLVWLSVLLASASLRETLISQCLDQLEETANEHHARAALHDLRNHADRREEVAPGGSSPRRRRRGLQLTVGVR